MEDKKSLRRKYKEIRNSVLEREEKSGVICNHAASLSEFEEAKAVLLYSSLGSEVDLSGLFRKAREMGKDTYYPRCVSSGEMKFYKVHDLSLLSNGSYGIKEPSLSEPVFESLKGAVCFVPALSYDEKGHRLGYGGGYYDRFLKDFDGVTVGVAFEECMAKILPAEGHDIKTDYIITESRVKRTIES